MIPDRCTIRVDSRPQPGIPAGEVRQVLEEGIERARAADPELEVEMILADEKRPHGISSSHPLVRSLAAAYTGVTGEPPAVSAASSASCARLPGRNTTAGRRTSRAPVARPGSRSSSIT